jgi:hypothetical protein
MTGTAKALKAGLQADCPLLNLIKSPPPTPNHQTLQTTIDIQPFTLTNPLRIDIQPFTLNSKPGCPLPGSRNLPNQSLQFAAADASQWNALPESEKTQRLADSRKRIKKEDGQTVETDDSDSDSLFVFDSEIEDGDAFMAYCYAKSMY